MPVSEYQLREALAGLVIARYQDALADRLALSLLVFKLAAGLDTTTAVGEIESLHSPLDDPLYAFLALYEDLPQAAARPLAPGEQLALAQALSDEATFEAARTRRAAGRGEFTPAAIETAFWRGLRELVHLTGKPVPRGSGRLLYG